jgi:cytoskeletal protein RodZ
MAPETKSKKFDLSNRLYVLLVLILVIGIAYFAWIVFYTYKAGDIEDANQITISANRRGLCCS